MIQSGSSTLFCLKYNIFHLLVREGEAEVANWSPGEEDILTAEQKVLIIPFNLACEKTEKRLSGKRFTAVKTI